MTVRDICQSIRRGLRCASASGPGGAGRLEALALALLYIGGMIVVPAVHKARVCCECLGEMSAGGALTRSGILEIAGESSEVDPCNHNPATCPICQLVSAPQIVAYGQMPFAFQHYAVADVCVVRKAFRSRLRGDAHRARGPPLAFC